MRTSSINKDVSIPSIPFPYKERCIKRGHILTIIEGKERAGKSIINFNSSQRPLS